MYNLFIVVSDAKTLSKFKPDGVASSTELSADTYDKIIIRRKTTGGNGIIIINAVRQDNRRIVGEDIFLQFVILLF